MKPRTLFTLAALACTARATIITIKITGTVSSGSDLTGVFLPGCTQNNPCDLKNQTFILVFTFDDTMGTPQPPGGSSIQQTADSNPGTALLTINGKSFEFAAPGRLGPYTSMAQSDIPPGQDDEYSVSASDLGSSVGGHLYPASGQSFGNGADWRASFTYSGAFTTGDALVASINELSQNPVQRASNIDLVPNSLQVNGLPACSSTSTTASLKPPSTTASLSTTCPTSTQPRILRVFSDGTSLDITNTSQPVVVGEEISLIAVLPIGATLGDQPWTGIEQGMAVGGYVVSSDSTTAQVIPLNVSSGSIIFYWLIPSTYPVTLSCNLNSQSVSVQVTFFVQGPTGAVVKPPMGKVQIQRNELSFGMNGKPVVFDASETPPPPVPGTFEWVQLLDDSTVVATTSLAGIPVVSQTCNLVLGPVAELDDGFPYDDGLITYDKPTWDLPGRSMPITEVNITFSARMFFMWKSAMPSTCDHTGLCTFIVVPLGYTTWGFTVDTQFQNSVWNKISESETASFHAVVEYPLWHGIVIVRGTRTGRNPTPPDCSFGLPPMGGRR